ncbi:MAG: hypothetical protein ACSLFQ_07470 [Thermoanaerobaculia bacterium]
MRKTLAALKALTPEQRAVLKDKRLSGSFTPHAALALLKPVGEFDRMSDKARTPIGCWSAALFVFSIVALIVTANGVLPWFLGVPLVLGLFGGFVYFLVTVIKLSKHDLSNNFREIALPFFALLKEDMESGEPMQFKLDLSSPIDKAKKTGESDKYELGVYHKVIDSYYRDAWFEGSAWLADGSALSWSVVEEITSSARTKRNARGKYKTKTKYRKVCQLAVDVALPNKHYGIDRAMQTEDTKVKFKAGEKRTTIRLATRVKLKENEPFDVRELVDLAAEAFRRAKPATMGGAA